MKEKREKRSARNDGKRKNPPSFPRALYFFPLPSLRAFFLKACRPDCRGPLRRRELLRRVTVIVCCIAMQINECIRNISLYKQRSNVGFNSTCYHPPGHTPGDLQFFSYLAVYSPPLGAQKETIPDPRDSSSTTNTLFCVQN